MLQVKEIVIATGNQGKLKEFEAFFAALHIQVRGLDAFENLPNIIEDGETFADNALIKARIISEYLGLPVLADDSGLCVDALDGRPGVYSARYAGEPSNDQANNAKLLQELDEIGARLGERERLTLGIDASHPPLASAAQFVCALAVIVPGEEEPIVAEGKCHGFILRQAQGTEGFGYDPLFYVPTYHRSMAQMSVTEKNRISHRAEALELLKLIITRRGS